jgi:hypothetical protein
MNEFNAFESMMFRERDAQPAGFRRATIDVCDTAYVARVWLESYTSAFTAADVVELAGLIMAREDAITRRGDAICCSDEEWDE